MKNWQLGLIIAIIVEIISALSVVICDYFYDGLACLAWGIPGFWSVAKIESLAPGSGVLQTIITIVLVTLLNTLLYTGIIWALKVLKKKFR